MYNFITVLIVHMYFFSYCVSIVVELDSQNVRVEFGKYVNAHCQEPCSSMAALGDSNAVI